jgi:hypothetical protein
VHQWGDGLQNLDALRKEACAEEQFRVRPHMRDVLRQPRFFEGPREPIFLVREIKSGESASESASASASESESEND